MTPSIFFSFFLILFVHQSTFAKKLDGDVDVAGKVGNQTVKGVVDLDDKKVNINGELENPIFTETTPKPEKIPTAPPKVTICRHCILYNLSLEGEWCPATRTIKCRGSTPLCNVKSTYIRTTEDKNAPYYHRGCASTDACENLRKDSQKYNESLPYACSTCTYDMCNNEQFTPVPELY